MIWVSLSADLEKGMEIKRRYMLLIYAGKLTWCIEIKGNDTLTPLFTYLVVFKKILRKER